MKVQLLSSLMGIVVRMLTPELLKNFMDMVLDFIEDQVEGSASKVDDAIVLPLCALIRATFDVPDND